MRPLILVALASLALLSACESIPTAPTYEQAFNNEFTNANYVATTELIRRYQGPASATNTSGGAGSAPFIVATLSNIDQLETSSTLGRLISEQVTSRLAQLGQSVVELKVRNGVFMRRNEGEFLLTREIQDVAKAHKAQAIIVGTYAASESFVYVSLKIVDPANSQILTAYDYAHPLNKQVKSLLRK